MAEQQRSELLALDGLRARHADDMSRAIQGFNATLGQLRTDARARAQTNAIAGLRKMCGALLEDDDKELSQMQKRGKQAEAAMNLAKNQAAHDVRWKNVSESLNKSYLGISKEIGDALRDREVDQRICASLGDTQKQIADVMTRRRTIRPFWESPRHLRRRKSKSRIHSSEISKTSHALRTA